MSEEQALVYVETIKTLLESVEKVEKEEEEEIRQMLLQRKLEEAEREEALRNLLRRGDFSFFAKERWSWISILLPFVSSARQGGQSVSPAEG